MDLSLMLDVPDACDHLKVFQILSFIELNCDFEFTVDFCRRLAAKVDYTLVAVYSQLLRDKPDLWLRFRVSPDFTLPSNISELRERLANSNRKESTPEPSAKVISTSEELPTVHDSARYIHPLEDDSLVLDSDVVELNELPVFDMPLVDISEVASNPSLVSRRQIRSRMRSARHHARVSSYCPDEFAQVKYRSADFVEGQRRGHYRMRRPPSASEYRGPPELYDELKLKGTLDVYEMTKSTLFGRELDFVVYAPPCSGKSTWNRDAGYYDTDYLPAWDRLYPDRVVTNMPHMLGHAKRSVAIVPDKCVFMERCRRRGLTPQESWYDDLLRECEAATAVIYSNNYVADLSGLIAMHSGASNPQSA